MAGGFGKRLHPLTSSIPKPLVPVCGKPIMSYVIDLLKKHGIDDIVVLLFHKPHLIKEYFGDGSSHSVKLTYLTADKDFGTAGAVKYAQQHIDGPFVVISADLITDFDLTRLIKFHKEKKAKATIALTRVDNPLDYGIVITREDGSIDHFLEKPSWGEVFSDTINTGIYVLDDEVLEHIPEEVNFDFSMDLFPKLLAEKQRLFGMACGGYWKDIGNLTEYRNTHKDIIEGGLKVCRVEVSDKADISPDAILSGDNIIAAGTSVGPKASVSGSIIGKGCSIGDSSIISNCVIWDDVTVGSDCILKDAIVANNVVIQDRVLLEEGSVVSDDTILESDSVVKSYIRIWPGKIVEEGSTVNSPMIWRQRWSKTIFGQYGITGTCNIDLTPEFAAKLGSSFGAMLGKGSAVTSSMDGHKASRMISRGLISGLLSAGVNVSNLEKVPSPINRYELKALKSKGGIHVRKSPFDPNLLDIKFFDSNGMDLSPSKEKAIERLFWGEDYDRASADETGELSFPFYRVAEGYKEGMVNFLDAGAIRDKGLKIVLDYSYGNASSIFPSILGRLGVETIALNAYIDENKFTKTNEQFQHALKQLSQIVPTLRANLGVMFDTGAEKLFVCDEKGRVLEGDTLLSLFACLVVNSGKTKMIAVPVTATSAIDEIAKKKKITVVRTKTSSRSMMEVSAEKSVDFFGESTGGFIFPGFQPSFDSMLATGKLLDLLVHADAPISEIVDSLPKRSLVKTQIPCPNALKGTVIRSVVDGNRSAKMELLDGVKLFFGGDWVLVNGHPDRQEVYVIAESAETDKAESLSARYAEDIRKVISTALGK